MLISDKQKQIITLLADGEFHSGNELAGLLNVSRSAVWKQILGLSGLGLQHSALRGKGYRLEKPLELLDLGQITAELDPKTHALITELEIHQQIDSTNSYLVGRGHHTAATGLVCFAEQQTAGKGRRGRHWVSPFGNNIHLSILWRFELNGPAALSGLSLAAGVAVIRALRRHGFDTVGLKWPNDIISHGKKLGGILIEVSGESGGPCTAVIGLGLNLFLPESEAADINQPWTDLTQISGHKPLIRNRLAGALLNELVPVIAGFESTGLNAYLDEWRRYDCLKGQLATLFIGTQTVNGQILGIDNNGCLLLEHADGAQQAFASGEISFTRPVL